MLDVVGVVQTRLSRTGAEIGSAQAYHLPKISAPLVFDPLVNWERRGDLARFGVELTGKPGPDSRIILDADAPPATARLRIELFGGRDHLIVMDGSHRLAGYARLESHSQTLIVAKGGAEAFYAHSIILRGQNTAVAIGAETTSNGVKLLVDGDNTSITIGDDCMFAHDIEIIATDSHSIFDATTLQHLNPPKSVRIGQHVWIGSQVSVLKGVHIGEGSIVGTKSLVTKDVPPMSLYAGSPAREIRTGVTWSRHLVPPDESKRAVLRGLGTR